MIEKIRSKVSKLSEPAKASIWFVICNILQKGILFITTPIFTRILSTSEYGKYTVFMSWYAIISIFSTLNLSAGVFNKGLVKYTNQDQLTSSFWGLSITVSTVLFIAYLPFHDSINKLLGMSTYFVVLIYIESVFQAAFLLWSVKERFDYKYKKLIVVTLFISIMNPLLGVLLIYIFNGSASGRIVGYVLVDAVVGIVLGINIFRKGKTFFNKEFWKYALVFNIPLIPHYLSMTVLNQADRLMIDKMVGSSQAAIYSIAYTISSTMVIVTNAINGSFIPFSYKAIKNADFTSIKNAANKLLLLIFLLCVAVMLIGPEAIWIVGGDEYMEAIWIIPPVASSVYFMFLYPLFGNIEFYYEKTKYVMVASLTGAVANCILNYFCIKSFGYIAAGYTTLLCYILFSFAHYFFYRKILAANKIKGDLYDLKFILILSTAILISMLLITFTYRVRFIRYILIVILIITLIINRKKLLESVRKLKEN